MSKPLSASTTFEALAARVSAIETNPTLNGILSIDDAHFSLDVESGNPTIIFDGAAPTADALVYVRASNVFLFYIAGTIVARLDSSGNLALKGTLSQNAL